MTVPPSLTDLVLQATPEQRAEIRAVLDEAEPKQDPNAAIEAALQARKERRAR